MEPQRGTWAKAPSAEAAVMVHQEAHGLLADRIYQIQEGEQAPA